MNILDTIKKVLNEEQVPEGKKGILLLDIDDTLLKSDASIMRIYRKLPSDKEEVALTTSEYANEHITPAVKKYYDYRDFIDPNKVFKSIIKGMPLINNLKVVDDFVKGGYDIGVLTARGCEPTVAKAINAFLKVRDKDGKLVPYKINASRIHAVNDDDAAYEGETDHQKKQNVLRKYADDYDYVYFMDDDAKNINALKALKKDPLIGAKLRSITAKKPTNEEESFDYDNVEVISEMAVKDVSDDIISSIKAGKYEDALRLYFNKIKDTATYASKPSIKDAFAHMLSYGITRTFNALEKKGTVPSGTSNKLKEVGAKKVDEIIAGLDDSKRADNIKLSPKASSAEKKPTEKYEDSPIGTLKKISDRVEKYNDLMRTIDDYISTGKSIIPFIVDIRANGESGIEAGVQKPKVTNDGNEFMTKTDRYVAPMLKYRANFIPDFVQKKAEKNMSFEDKKNLEKAEMLGKEYLEATRNKIYSKFMSAFLNNIVMGLRDFKLEHKNEKLDDAATLKLLKDDYIDFPYEDFVKLEKWAKNLRMAADKKASENALKSGKSAAIPDEIYEVRKEWVAFVNALEKADTKDKAAEFISDPNNLAIILAALSTPAVPNPDKTKAFMATVDSLDSSKNLLPTLKGEYNKRADFEYNSEAPSDYEKLAKDIRSVLLNRYNAMKAKNASEVANIEDIIGSFVPEIRDVFLDKLAALDILVKTAGSGVLGDTKKATERYKAIQVKLAKSGINSKKAAVAFDPKSDKYKKYYDPEGEKREKAETIAEISKKLVNTIKAVPFEKIVAKKLQVAMYNLRSGAYTDEELIELNNALNKSEDDFLNLLATDKYKGHRNR